MATVVISLVSTKGGVGKTTVAANLAGLTAALGLRTLLIDGDVQPALSKYFILEEAASTGMAEVISSGGLITTREITRVRHFHLIFRSFRGVAEVDRCNILVIFRMLEAGDRIRSSGCSCFELHVRVCVY